MSCLIKVGTCCQWLGRASCHKMLGKISKVKNLPEICFSSFSYFVLTHHVIFFSKIRKVHNLSEILFSCFSYFVLTPPCEFFPKIKKKGKQIWERLRNLLIFENNFTCCVRDNKRKYQHKLEFYMWVLLTRAHGPMRLGHFVEEFHKDQQISLPRDVCLQHLLLLQLRPNHVTNGTEAWSAGHRSTLV